MRKPVLTIFYQFNPWNTTIGGIQTLINIFIKYAPKEFEVRLVGTGDNTNQPMGRWQEADFAGRSINFLPLFAIENDNVRHLIPTTLKYTAALLGRCYASDFMHFYRLEPTLAVLNWVGEKTLFIQNDIQKQIESQEQKNAILWRRFPAGYYALEGMLVGQFDQIFSCNTDSLELYQRRYPSVRDRLSYLKNTFDQEVFYPLSAVERQEKRRQLTIQLGLSEDTSFALFAGRLHPQKDPALLIRAITALNDPKIHLLMVGDGELAQEVRSLIGELNLQNRVTMLGAKKQAELADLHRVCNALVLSSAFEGLPFVVLEALACGTPIVTTKAGDTPRLLNANSGIVCERTPESLADALRKVIMNPDDYPVTACVEVAAPYAARRVVNEVYSQMWQRWEQRCLVGVS
jgi:glycosyltransferase involved in cell wall biosynthesis